MFLDDAFYGYITIQTNIADQYLVANPELPPHSRYRQWKPVTSAEMKKFISFYLLPGIIRKPLISQYWSTNPLIRTPFFNIALPRNRFQSILEFLHFNDNTYNPNYPDRDRLYQIRPVVEYLVSKFKTVYTPEQHVAIDEELLLWKGRVGFKQYMPSKRARFCIKMFSLSEVPGCLWNSFVTLEKTPLQTTLS